MCYLSNGKFDVFFAFRCFNTALFALLLHRLLLLGRLKIMVNPLGKRLWRREPYAASLGSHDGVLGGVVKILVSGAFYKLVCYNFSVWRDIHIYCASHRFIQW